MNVVAFGEVLWDIQENKEYIGGAPLNFAAHFKKCGGTSWIITAVGRDELGNKTIEQIEKMGINTEFVSYSEKETGKCLVWLDENRIPTYNLLNNVAYDYIKKPEMKGNPFDVLYFGTLSLRNENNRKVLKQIISENEFKDIFVDMNIRKPFYSEEVIRFAFNNATVLKISDEELSVVMGVLNKENLQPNDCAKIISKEFKNVRIIIITKGDKGSYVYDCTANESYEIDAKKVEVVSTVGAGDSFSASFLAEYLSSGDIKKALSLATKISGYVVSNSEAIPSYDIKQFI